MTDICKIEREIWEIVASQCQHRIGEKSPTLTHAVDENTLETSWMLLFQPFDYILGDSLEEVLDKLQRVVVRERLFWFTHGESFKKISIADLRRLLLQINYLQTKV